MKSYPTITPTAAARLGYHSITMTYRAAAYEMLDRVIEDMQTGGSHPADYVLVNTGMDGIEVWRHTRELSVVEQRDLDAADSRKNMVGRAGR